MTNEGGIICPVCIEEMDLTDLQLKPCKCGYEVCIWCWHNIMNMAEKDGTEGRCPACRTPYDKKLMNMEASVEIERKFKPQKAKSRASEGRKHLSNVRVVQRHLVYTMGLPAELADEDVLQRREYFGQYGKVLKASLTRTSGGAIQYSTNNTCSVYITYSKVEEALRCIQSVNNYILQGQPLRACFGTTKYCHAWLRNMPCGNSDCVYLHDVGNQEDSFTKDEPVSSYTRVQQITGAANNLERRAGNVLPPPVDESWIGGTTNTPSKPLSRSPPSDNLSSQLKCSPPNSSSGRSISLPAAASWGLRVSNGHHATSNSASSNGPSTQKHEDCNGSIGFPSLVASAMPVSLLQTDVGKKSWVTKESRPILSSVESGSSEYSKQYAVVDHQKTSETLGEVLQDPAPTAVASRDLPSLVTQRDDNLDNTGTAEVDRHHSIEIDRQRSIEIDGQSCVDYSDKDGNGAVDGKIQSVGSESVSIGTYHNNELSTTEPSPSVSNQSFYSFRNHGIQQSYSEHGEGHLTSLPSRKVDTSDRAFAPRESSNWSSESQTQVLRGTYSALEGDLLALGEQHSNFNEVCHPLHVPRRPSSSNISSSSNGNNWPYDQACGTSNSLNRDFRSFHSKDDEDVLPFTSRDSVLSNGYTENNVSTSSDLEKILEQSNLFPYVEKGKYSGRSDVNPVDFEKSTSLDMGESNIISDILSWDESLASPHNLSKLLSETDNQHGGLKIRNARKEQQSNQSRFSFARQVDYAEQGTDSGLHHNFGNTKNTSYASQAFQDDQDLRLDELPHGLSSKFWQESATVYSSNQNWPSNRFSVSRAPVSAPPGFSAPSKVPPPGFSAQERTDKAFEANAVNQFFGNPSLMRSQYHVQPTMEMASIGDVELIDPAILAVGTGRPANGMNDFGLDIRSNPSLQLGASENDHRLQFLRQQFLPPQQNVRYSDHVGDRFSPLTDVYNTPSRFLDQSQFAQLSLQPRTENISHGWNSWNDAQSGNNLSVGELFKNERYGFNQYYPDYDNRNSRMPKQNDLYNKAFGM